jgi:Cu-processing system ATP-binding protein
MVVPDSGTISFRERDIRHDHSYRADIGYMPQIGRYPDNMTIGQLIDMMKDIRRSADGSTNRSADGSPNRSADQSGKPTATRPLDEDLINELGLRQLFHKRMRSLSGGTRQKVSACLAFLFDPTVLVLDEPTAGLDPVSSGILKEKIDAETAKGKLILITSHILSELDDLVDEVVYLQEGRVKFHKTITQIQADTGEEKLVRAIAHLMV